VRSHIRTGFCCMLATASLATPVCSGAFDDAPTITPSILPRIGTVDARFQSYNIEMVEVTGGRFWKPYRSQPDIPLAPPPRAGSDPPPGRKDADLLQYRPPIDLGNARLRKLASALAPAYLRVSGTWANSTYFADSDDAPSAPPAGFNGMLTRRQWQGVVDFSHAVNAEIVTSFAISAGSRDIRGVWTSEQVRRLLDYTGAIGGHLAAAEFMNEPDLPGIGGAPAGYDAAAYERDFRVFHAFAKQAAPELLILGPGTITASSTATDLLAETGSGLDVVSYHHYGTLSQRCIGSGNPEAALSEEWLSRADRSVNFYKALRDRFAPGKPIWLTETAEAACGGNPWAATFLDTFRYLDQLGRLAKAGVQVVMHNTLAASDYGLLDERTLEPRPNYWGAVLWRQLMGSTVLDADVPVQSGLHVYAHCLRDTPGGVALLVINTDRHAPHTLILPTASVRYTMDAADLLDRHIQLNGRTLTETAVDQPPPIVGAPTSANALRFEQATIAFLGIPEARNDSCR
jgi:heparanase 1